MLLFLARGSGSKQSLKDLCRWKIGLPSNFEKLVKQVELLEDYEASSQALMEIVHREPVTGAQLASNILLSKAGDIHLRAFAFSMLYRANKTRAFEYMLENSSTCESVVFAAMLGEVAEDFGLLSDSRELQRVVAHLRSTIRARSDKDVEVVKRAIDGLLRIYGN